MGVIEISFTVTFNNKIHALRGLLSLNFDTKKAWALGGLASWPHLGAMPHGPLTPPSTFSELGSIGTPLATNGSTQYLDHLSVM